MTRDQEIRLYFTFLQMADLKRDMYYHRGAVRYLLKDLEKENKEYCKAIDKMNDEELYAEFSKKRWRIIDDE